nr:hypothetical protein [Tanacetum cinerariifolium]
SGWVCLPSTCVVIGADGYAYLAIGWLLEEIQVTWAQLEKKQTRPRLYTNYLEENLIDRGDGVANHTRRHHITQETASWISRRRQNVADLKKP